MDKDKNQENLKEIIAKPGETGEISIPEKIKQAEQLEGQLEFEGGGQKLEKEEQRSEPISQIKTDDSRDSDSVDIVSDPEVKKIENILAEDLEDIYKNLPSEKQVEFKKRGEETAVQISLLLKNVKIKVKEVLELIRDWLKIIPGVNKFFLEQEAKIKTDKLLSENKTKNSK